jgi:hypothetical protein
MFNQMDVDDEQYQACCSIVFVLGSATHGTEGLGSPLTGLALLLIFLPIAVEAYELSIPH